MSVQHLSRDCAEMGVFHLDEFPSFDEPGEFKPSI
jgi:hypothetical protein